MTTAAIAFVPMDAANSPNIKTADVAKAYYDSMTVAFASLRRWNPDLHLTLVTTSALPAAYDEPFDRMGVELRKVHFAHRPPDGFFPTFSASLYMLDAIAALADEDTIWLDPDVLCVAPVDKMLREVGSCIGAMPLGRESYILNMNGLTLGEAAQLHGILDDEPSTALHTHYGGECYFMPSTYMAEVIARSERAWNLSLERFAGGATRMTTEEHILSYAIKSLPVQSLSPYVRRIWTAAVRRTVTGREGDLTFWHLPAEKDRGFAQMCPDSLDESSWFWTFDRASFVERAGRVMGLHHRPIKRAARDFLTRKAKRAQYIVHRVPNIDR